MTLTNPLGGTVQSSDIILFVSYAAAIVAILPYWTQPIDATGSSAVALAAESFSHMLGFYGYLSDHPIRAVAAAPATLITLRLLLNPVSR